MRAAIYARVSTERQQTIDSQLAALRAWAEAEGHELSDRHVFRDEGHSGARLDRPALDALRDAVRDGRRSTARTRSRGSSAQPTISSVCHSPCRPSAMPAPA